MSDADRPPDDRPSSDPPDPGEGISILVALAVLLNAISVCGSAYAVFAAVTAIRWHRAENLALMALVVVGFPTLFVQVVAILPFTLFCAERRASRAPGSRVHGLRYLAVLPPVVTSTAILMGMAISS